MFLTKRSSTVSSSGHVRLIGRLWSSYRNRHTDSIRVFGKGSFALFTVLLNIRSLFGLTIGLLLAKRMISAKQFLKPSDSSI
jgi:hypothetical protein